LNLVDHVLPDTPIRQFVLTMPFPLRFPLAFDGKLLGQVVRIFTDTVAGSYRRRQVERGLPTGEPGAVTAIQRANSDVRLNPYVHAIFLDGIVGRASKRILRFLQRRGVITYSTR
jgi:hypothetical protein